MLEFNTKLDALGERTFSEFTYALQTFMDAYEVESGPGFTITLLNKTWDDLDSIAYRIDLRTVDSAFLIGYGHSEGCNWNFKVSL